ncbi:MAG: hypothetical protein DRQ10_01090 [Candidatus Hydrothermota bacterium]|nr:MAG: hypothetical protein DRQ10_01090 [Candidatus Hydrothermae bacterium]
MWRDVVGTLVIFFWIVLFLGISEQLRKKGKISEEGTRKLVHIGVGTIILFAPVMMTHRIGLLILSALFTFVNGYSLLQGKLSGIHSVERETFGTVVYPISVFIITLLFWDFKEVFFISLSALFFGDAFAAMVGERWPIKKFGDKSLSGSTVMFLTTLASAVFFKAILHSQLSWSGLVAVALIGTMLEASISGGFDNFTVPIGTALFLYHLVLGGDHLTLWQAIGAGVLIAVPSYWLEYLTADGAYWTAIVAVTVVVFGGWVWLAAILAFFLSSSLLTKLLADRSEVKAGEARDSHQVLANGGVPLIIAILNRFVHLPNIDWFVLYLISLAIVNSDTWSTELGTLSPTDPRSIIDWRAMPKGSSGAISFVGTLGGLAGAAFIALIATFAGYGMDTFILITAAGLLGNFIDSILGATIEVKYLCEKCGRVLDVEFHCGQKTQYLSGFKWFGNNTVNFTASLLGIALVLIVQLVS